MQVIYVNGYCLSQEGSGVHGFALNILQHLDKLNSMHTVPLNIICLVPKKINFSFNSIKVIVLQAGIKIIDNKQTIWGAANITV